MLFEPSARLRKESSNVAMRNDPFSADREMIRAFGARGWDAVVQWDTAAPIHICYANIHTELTNSVSQPILRIKSHCVSKISIVQ